MKSFKQFIKEKVKPIIVDALPVHGSHAYVKEQKELKEEGYYERLAAHQKLHLGYTPEEHKEKHQLSHEQWHGLEKGYRVKKAHQDNHHSSSIRDSVSHYTGSSTVVNHALINDATGKPSAIHSYKKSLALTKKTKGDGAWHQPKFIHDGTRSRVTEQIHHLDHAIKKYPLKHDTKLMHGCGFNPDHFASQHPDRHIHMPAYTSVSSKADVARSFSSRGAKTVREAHETEHGKDEVHTHTLRIHLPKGHHALPVYGHSNLDHEDETILPRGLKLKVSHHPYHKEVHDDTYTKTIHHYWDAHPVKETKTK